MLVVRVELWSAVTGEKTEIARLDISNMGPTPWQSNSQVCDYRVRTYRGRDKETLDDAHKRQVVTRGGYVRKYHRMKDHVWNLVSLSLQSAGYGVRSQPDAAEPEEAQSQVAPPKKVARKRKAK